MPNWCMNKLTLSHPDPKMMEKAVKSWNTGFFLKGLIPCPQELIDTVSGSVGLATDGDVSQRYKVELHEFQMQLNLKHFGYKDWYDWCVNEWGTKWDFGKPHEDDPDVELVDGKMVVFFDSAWSPPTNAYDKLVDLGYTIEAYYFEPGMAFCGRYDEEGDYTLQIESNSKWAKKNIPRDIDEAFDIVETMQNYEEAA